MSDFDWESFAADYRAWLWRLSPWRRQVEVHAPYWIKRLVNGAGAPWLHE